MLVRRIHILKLCMNLINIYGWSKFIIVVPITIREGVYKNIPNYTRTFCGRIR